MSELTTVQIRKESKPLFEQAKDLAAEDLGDRVTNADAFEEICRAYLGNDPCGRWRGE